MMAGRDLWVMVDESLLDRLERMLGSSHIEIC